MPEFGLVSKVKKICPGCNWPLTWKFSAFAATNIELKSIDVSFSAATQVSSILKYLTGSAGWQD